MSSLKPRGESMEHLSARADETTNETLEATRRMLAYCEESKEAGIKTLVMLDEQGDQLEAVESALEAIHLHMDQAQQNLHGMESSKCCCGWWPWSRSDSINSSASWHQSEDGTIVEEPRISMGLTPIVPQGGFITRLTHDAREDEADDNLGQVSSIVGTLKSMALDMSAEISRQNRQVDRIGAKAQTNDEHVSAASKKATKLMDK